MKLVFGDMCVPQDIDKLLGCECVSVWGKSFHCLNCLPGSGILECLSRTRQQNIPGGSEFTSQPLKSPDILWSVAQKTIPSNLLFICSFICDHFLWIFCVYCYHTSVALFWVKHLNNKFVRLSSHKGLLCPLKCCGLPVSFSSDEALTVDFKAFNPSMWQTMTTHSHAHCPC